MKERAAQGRKWDEWENEANATTVKRLPKAISVNCFLPLPFLLNRDRTSGMDMLASCFLYLLLSCFISNT